ncbi:hypothetical protein DPMN_005390 [Dreissena polymorpha]|uniref:Uncharacterized protein n=1 Tax=Dreissena polymorpha TaxID=45954 RepID=A0A9D4MT59_DREPO|nr:hypothetical protein DPMN_005390 [Dreissena polymorpha]
METRNRKRRRPSVKLHQHPSQNLPGTSQQPCQLPSTQMPDQLPPNQKPVQLPATPSHQLGQLSSNQQPGQLAPNQLPHSHQPHQLHHNHQPDQMPLCKQLGYQMQPTANQPDPAFQLGNSCSEDIFLVFTMYDS